MAYFANSTEGSFLDDQCIKCRLHFNCSVAFVQDFYNYDQCGNKLAENILNSLIGEDGVCKIFDENKMLLQMTEDEINQLELDFGC